MVKLTTDNKDFLTIPTVQKLLNMDLTYELDECGSLYVNRLSAATPVDTGKTAASWNHTVTKESLTINNTQLSKEGCPIVILIDNGHATKNNGFVPARPFIEESVDGNILSESIEKKIKNM